MAVSAKVVASTPPATTGRKVSYAIEVEDGLGLDESEFADHVHRTLLGADGWQPEDQVRFIYLSPADRAEHNQPDIIVTLASPQTTDRLCAPVNTAGKYSCFHDGRAVINSARWLTGVPQFGGDIDLYRTYVINHEVGHGIGHGHVTCPAAGGKAPVMMQQSIDLHGCQPWGWPNTDGV